MTTNAFAPRWVRPEEVPPWDADEILPGLYMGGTADDDVVFVAADRNEPPDAVRRYDVVVTLYAWAQPVTWDVEELRYGFSDGDIAFVDVERVVRAARWAFERWTAGDRVLIRCQAGLNRSGLVTALVLMLDGYSADAAITVIRLRRSPFALCNDEFVQWLYDGAGDSIRADSSR